MGLCWRLLLAILAFTLAVLPAHAQTGTGGSISGHVTDQSGTPLHGVGVTAESEALMGKRAVYTNDEGAFHIMGLSPGSYMVTATAPGMNPVVSKDVAVGITSDTELDILMEVKTAEETVTVVERPSVISTTRAAVKETYDIQMVEALPFNDPINQFRDIIDMTPGTLNRRVRGGGQRQTLFTQDGFEIKEQFPSLRSSAAFEIQTAGYGADAPTASGGVENLVTRSGSNDFRFELTVVGDTDQFAFFRDLGETTNGQKRLVINPTISGPILKDKLWYHLNIEMHLISQPNPRDPFLVLPEPDPFFNVIPKVTAKTRWQISSRNKLEFLFNGDWPYQENNRRNAGISNEAQQDRLAQRYFGGVTFESLLTDSLLFRSQAGYVGFFQNIYPANCRDDRSPDTCYTTRNIRQRLPTTLEFENGPKHDQQALNSLQFINTLEYFLNTERFGDHNFRLRDTIYLEKDEQSTRQTGDAFYEYNGTIATNITTFYVNDPRLEEPEYGKYKGTVDSLKHVLTLSDTWKITPRLTALPAFSFIQAKARNNFDTFPFDTTTWAPAMSLVWDVSGDGSTVLRTSGSVYVDVDLSLVGRHPVGAQVTLRCTYDAATGDFTRDCTYAGGASRNTVGLPCGPTGLDENGNSCKQELDIPRTYEATAGVSRALGVGTALGFDAIYRRFTNQFEDVETNRIWNQAGTGVIGFRSGVNETVLDLQTPDGAYREYLGFTVSLAKTEGDLRLNGSYTLGWLNGTVQDGFRNLYGDVPPMNQYLDGPLPEDHRHEIKLTGSWLMAPWLQSGFRYIYTSGTPYNHLYYNPVTNAFNSYRADTGTDPGNNINDPSDDRTLRQPDQQSINVQLRMMFAPWIGQDLSAFVEVLNVLGLRTPLTVGTADGRDFSQTLTRVEPFRVRLGIDYRWGG